MVSGGRGRGRGGAGAGAGAARPTRPYAAALAAAAVSAVAAGAAGLTLDEFRASWANSPKIGFGAIKATDSELTEWDYDLDLCTMAVWKNNWRVRPE